MTRSVTFRMAEAKAKLIANRRTPRVFFLNPDDFDEFAATKPGTVEAMFAVPLGHKPSLMTCLGFEGIAVRQTLAKPNPRGLIHSRLICCVGTEVLVPKG